jgi:predicted Zn-dependent protease
VAIAPTTRQLVSVLGVRTVKRLILALAFLVATGIAYGVYVASVRQSAVRLHQLAEDACYCYDFASAHAHLVAYLELRPEDTEARLLAARCARRAEFLEDYTGPDATLREQASRHLNRIRHSRRESGHETMAAAATLEEMLGLAQSGDLSSTELVLLVRVGERGPEAPLILEALICGYLRHLQCDKALVCIDSLLRLEPENGLALLWRGRIHEQIWQVRKATEDFASAIRIVPDFDAARYYLAESLLRSKRVGEAKTHLQVLKGRAPDNLLVRLAWATCQIEAGENDIGRELLDRWLEDAPKDHPRLLEALTARAGLALTSGQAAEAERFARRALKESALDQQALYALARSLDLQGRGQEARAIETQLRKIKEDLHRVAQCREELARDPNDLHLRHEIGAAYLRLDRPGEALVWLNGILDRDPQYRPALQALADYHARSGHTRMAAEMQRRLAESQ